VSGTLALFSGGTLYLNCRCCWQWCQLLWG